MKTRLPADSFGGDSWPLYLEYIADFSESNYRTGRSDILAQHVLLKIKDMEDNPEVSDQEQYKKSVSGHIFEFLVAEMLVMHKIIPFFTQAEMWQVPSSKFDFLLFDEICPVVLSSKLSLGDRWRQVEIEGVSLKQIYRKGQCFLIAGNTTRAKGEVRSRNKAIEREGTLGINKCYVAGTEELFDFLTELSKRSFITPKKINPLVNFSQKIPKHKKSQLGQSVPGKSRRKTKKT